MGRTGSRSRSARCTLSLTRDRDLAYTTVMTVLDRLAKKGLVHRERDGRAYLYPPAQTREELVADVMHTALEGEAGPTGRPRWSPSSAGSAPRRPTAMREALAALESQA